MSPEMASKLNKMCEGATADANLRRLLMVEPREVLKDEIARRAYETYIQRGGENG